MNWEPVLTTDEIVRALEIVRTIALSIRDLPPISNLGASGAAGIALFLAYVEAAGVAEDLCPDIVLGDCIRAATATATHMPVGLWTGCSGLRWVIDHVADDDVSNAIIKHLDDAVVRILTHAPSGASFDIYTGLAGVSLAYVDERSSVSDHVIELVNDRLMTIDWQQTKDVPGCAHGFAGIIAALSRCVASGVDVERATWMLNDLISRVMMTDYRGARVCWCRGETGIALALLAASRALHRPEIEQSAIVMALSPFEDSAGEWPTDAMLCHGTAGLAHMCNRMYHATGEHRFRDHARDWLLRTMALQRPGEGIGGFQALRRKPEPCWQDNPTLLVGSAGVGLALLAGASTLPPHWDRLLAADVQGRSSAESLLG